jgi:hypothetical protein
MTKKQLIARRGLWKSPEGGWCMFSADFEHIFLCPPPIIMLFMANLARGFVEVGVIYVEVGGGICWRMSLDE